MAPTVDQLAVVGLRAVMLPLWLMQTAPLYVPGDLSPSVLRALLSAFG